MLSAWFAGVVTLLLFPYLRVGVLLAYGVSGVCGLGRRSRLPFVVVILFLCLLVLHLFWGWSGLVTGLWPLLRLLVLDSFDTQLHRPDALASGRTLSFCRRGSLPWAFAWTWISGPCPCLGSSLLWVCSLSLVLGFRLATLAVGWYRHLLLSWALPSVLPSRFRCWLLACGGWGLSLVVLPP